jgi:large subunit ribosomal protein L3
MAGHWGAETVRVQSLLVVDVLPELEVILVKGSVPGHPKGILIVEKSKIANRRSQRLKLNRIKHIPENLVRNEQ